MSNPVLRFAVGQADGPRSGTWRIWFGPADLFAATRQTAETLKISIHYPRPRFAQTIRYFGYSKQSIEKWITQEPVRLKHRLISKWSGLEFFPGYFIEFRIRIPATELRCWKSVEAEDTYWIEPPKPGQAAEILVLSGPPHHIGPIPMRADGGATRCLLEHSLKNQKRIWVLHNEIPGPSNEDMGELKAQAWRAVVSRGLQRQFCSNTDGRRVVLTKSWNDGTLAEIELAGEDFSRWGR